MELDTGLIPVTGAKPPDFIKNNRGATWQTVHHPTAASLSEQANPANRSNDPPHPTILTLHADHPEAA